MSDRPHLELRLSRAEFVLLLDLIGVALDRMTQVQESLGVEDKAFVDQCDQLEQSILKAGSKAFAGLTERDSLTENYVPIPSVVAEFRAHEVTQLRDDDFFWDELASRLAEMQAMRRVGPSRWEKLSDAHKREACEIELPGVTQHLNEFGIDRMFVLDRDPHG